MSLKGVLTPPQSPSLGPTLTDELSDVPIHRLKPSHLEPPVSTIDVAQEAQRIEAYFGLKKRLEAAGLFDRSDLLRGYGPDLARYILLGGTAFALFFLYAC